MDIKHFYYLLQNAWRVFLLIPVFSFLDIHGMNNKYERLYRERELFPLIRRDNNASEDLEQRTARLERVARLVRLGANVNARNVQLRTPLIVAVLYGDRAVMRVLLDLRADVTVKSSAGDNLLHMAAQSGHVGVVEDVFNMVNPLGERRFDINSRRHDGVTPLMMAAAYGHRLAMRRLRELGGDVRLTERQGYNMLHSAALGGHVEMIVELLGLTDHNGERIFDINQGTLEGYTPLIAAIDKKRGAAALKLIRLGADVNSCSRDGSTALGYAFYKLWNIVRELVHAGAVIDGGSGRTPLDYAQTRDRHRACDSDHVSLEAQLHRWRAEYLQGYRSALLVVPVPNGVRQLIGLYIESPRPSLIDATVGNVRALPVTGDHYMRLPSCTALEFARACDVAVDAVSFDPERVPQESLVHTARAQYLENLMMERLSHLWQVRSGRDILPDRAILK